MIRVDGDRVYIRGTRMDYICEIATLVIALTDHDSGALIDGLSISDEILTRLKGKKNE